MKITDFCTFGLGTLLFLLPLLPAAQESVNARWSKIISGDQNTASTDKA
jgi:hypothetical protein